MTAAGRASDAAPTTPGPAPAERPEAAPAERSVPRTGLLVGGLVLLAVVAVVSIGVGARSVPPSEVLR
ncbi:hypothetical protein ACFWX4_42630, partial [Streptomyces sp. NPDC059063]